MTSKRERNMERHGHRSNNELSTDGGACPGVGELKKIGMKSPPATNIEEPMSSQGHGLKLNQCGVVLDLGQRPSLAGPQIKPISDFFFFQSLHGRG